MYYWFAQIEEVEQSGEWFKEWIILSLNLSMVCIAGIRKVLAGDAL